MMRCGVNKGQLEEAALSLVLLYWAPNDATIACSSNVSCVPSMSSLFTTKCLLVKSLHHFFVSHFELERTLVFQDCYSEA